MTETIVIVGAGILGLATAYALVERGIGNVHVVDRACPGAGATGRSGALVHCSYVNETEIQLATYSLAFYRDFDRRVGGDAGFLPTGLLVMASPEGATGVSELAALQNRLGVDIAPIERADAERLAPYLKTKDAGVIMHHASAGCCDANLTTVSYVAALQARGVTFEFERSVLRVRVEAGRVTGVVTDNCVLDADTVVVAAGPWARGLLPADVDLRMIPQLTRVAVFRPWEFGAGTFPAIIDAIKGAWFRPMGGGAILVGSEHGLVYDTDPASIPSAAPNALVESYRDVLTNRFAVSTDAAPRGSWAGAYMLSPDHRPIVGELPGCRGFYILGGDGGGGFKIAPALGLALAEQIDRRSARTFDVEHLSPGRFLRSEVALAGVGASRHNDARV